MRLVIHDLSEIEFSALNMNNEDSIIISDNGDTHNCIGCFGCWIKTPGQCIIKDKYMSMGANLAKCSELVLISKCCYGSYSPFVKNIMDRSISYILPDFVVIGGEMHHKKRYDKSFKIRVVFYGEAITQKEKNTAEHLVYANKDNFYAEVESILFVKNTEELGGAINESSIN